MEQRQHALATAIASFAVCTACSNCKVLLLDWTTVVPKVILGGQELTIVGHLSYLDSFMTKDGSTVPEVSTRLSEVQVERDEPKYLQQRPDISLKLEGYEHCSAVRFVLPYGYKTLRLCSDDVYCLEVLSLAFSYCR